MLRETGSHPSFGFFTSLLHCCIITVTSRSKKEYRTRRMFSFPAYFSGTMACILRGMIAARFAFFRHNVAYHTDGALCRVGRTNGFSVWIPHYFGTVLRRISFAHIAFDIWRARFASSICTNTLHLARHIHTHGMADPLQALSVARDSKHVGWYSAVSRHVAAQLRMQLVSTPQPRILALFFRFHFVDR